MRDPIETINEVALARMTHAAWWEAVRCSQEVQAYRAGAPDRLGRFPADAILCGAAESAQAYYMRLAAEQTRRMDHDDCDHGCLIGDPKCPKGA